MRSLIYKILPGNGKPYNSEIISVHFPNEQDPDFKIDVATWLDEHQFRGEKRVRRILVAKGLLLEEMDERDIVGYELRNLYRDDVKNIYYFDTTIRRIPVLGRKIVIE